MLDWRKTGYRVVAMQNPIDESHWLLVKPPASPIRRIMWRRRRLSRLVALHPVNARKARSSWGSRPAVG